MIVNRFFKFVWKTRNPVALILWPISLIYCAAAQLRRIAYAYGLLPVARFTQPVIAVGNITVGGTGKTPFTIWLVEFLNDKGFKPGVVSRGYGRSNSSETLLVRPDSDPCDVGDEPLLIVRRTGVPVAVSSKRSDAVNLLLENSECDIFICDDALQHYSIGTDISIALIDAEERFGNSFCLPAGPLRERPSRLESVDIQLVKGKGEINEHSMNYELAEVVNVKDNHRRTTLESLKDRKITAIAGISNPWSYFEMLRKLGIECREIPFPDHHRFTEKDFADLNHSDSSLLMTEKDAVKCDKFADSNWWFTAINVTLSEEFVSTLSTMISQLNKPYQSELNQ